MLTPANPKELCDAIRSHPRVLAVGAQTKPRLTGPHGDAALISTRALSGIVGYDPGEFTFTALAGTPLREIRDTLEKRGQYLPFDPPLVDAGATLGGTVAAGLSGPGRFRYGGVRDFILAVQFADGAGRLLRGGAKVVKNAAGFDIPKFLTGSLGRFGVLTELTFKVFPAPESWLTLRIPCAGLAEAAVRIAQCAASRWEADAIEIEPLKPAHEEGHVRLLVRLGGPSEANAGIAAEIARRFADAEVLAADEADEVWRGLREFAWAHATGLLAKIPVTLASLESLGAALMRFPGSRVHFSAAGNVAFVSLPPPARSADLDAVCRALTLRGIVLRGDGGPMQLGSRPASAHEGHLRTVFDPCDRFPPLE